MNHSQLEHFLILAKYLHFGKASQICHLSPSTLTRSIQRLEGEVGQALFLRDNRTVSLTPAGEKFRNYAAKTLHHWQNFHETLQGGDEVGGQVSIYASVTAVYTLLPELLEDYRESYPKVNLELHTGSAEESIQQVISEEIDISIAALPDEPLNGLAFLPLLETDLVFIAPRNFTDELDLKTSPLVIPHSGLSRKRLDHFFKEQNIHPNIRTEVSGNEAIIAMVRLGCGIGIVPELVLKRSPFLNDMIKISKSPKLEPYTVGLCTREKSLRRASISALWELAKR